MTEPRKMTIARGLTRIKTIEAQLTNIIRQIEQYAAWVNKEKHPLGDTNLTNDDAGLKRNHAQAAEKMASLWQSYLDLSNELVKIQTAINRANDTTMIQVAGETMTIAVAKVIENRIIGQEGRSTAGLPGPGLVNAYRNAVAMADRAVKNYNAQFNNVKDEQVKKEAMADIAYMLPAFKVEHYANFINEFRVEFNATLNEVNAVTEITV